MAILSIFLIVLLSALMPMFRFSPGYILKFYEEIVSMVAAIYCSYLMYNGGDLEVCLTCHISAFKLFFMKFLSFFSLILAMGALQFFVSLIFFNFQVGYVTFMALIPSTLFLSSFSFMLTLLLKNTSSSNTILLVFIVFEAWVAESLGRGILPRYYYEFVSVFDTCSMYGSSL